MSSFTDPLDLRFLDLPLKKKPFMLLKEFGYYVGEEGERKFDVITVPVGFRTDFASIPKKFWSVLSPIGRHGKAAVIHDYLYNTQTRPRMEADRIFLEAMEVLGVPAWKRRVMYRAVRTFARYK